MIDVKDEMVKIRNLNGRYILLLKEVEVLFQDIGVHINNVIKTLAQTHMLNEDRLKLNFSLAIIEANKAVPIEVPDEDFEAWIIDRALELSGHNKENITHLN